MRKSQILSKKLRNFEPLEQRNLLAGNVTTAQTGSQLVILGDSSANVLTITESGGVLKIAGAGTKVDGHTSETFTGVDNLFIDMGAGNDVLTIKGVTLTGNTGNMGLGILLGSGTDALVMSGVEVYFRTGIDGGSGNNAIAIDKSEFDYDLGIQTYAGADAVAITRTNVEGGLSIQLGDGTNALSMVSDNISEEVPGSPTVLPPQFEVLENAFFDIDCGAIIEGGSGVDAIAMNGVQIDCLTEINTCSGVDSVAIVNSRFGNQEQAAFTTISPDLAPTDDASGLCIETGLGNDAVSIVTTNVYGFLQVDTSGQVCCPCEEQSSEVAPNTPTSSSTKDGNDAVALVKVNVYASEQAEPAPDITTDEVSTGNCCIDCGALLIYTGNQNDAVSLASVNTDCYAFIDTTDCTNSNLDGADAVVIANCNFNREDSCTRDVGLCIVTGNGNDAVAIAKTSVVGKTVINTGDGTDAVSLAFLVTDEICAELGPGKYDALTVSNCTSTDEIFADDGGSGGVLNYKHLNNHFTNAPLITVAGWSTVV